MFRAETDWIQSLKLSTDCLFRPGRTAFSLVKPQHAMVAVINMVCDSINDASPWRENPECKTDLRANRIVELFHRRNGAVYYIGTYKVLEDIPLTEDDCLAFGIGKGRMVRASCISC